MNGVNNLKTVFPISIKAFFTDTFDPVAFVFVMSANHKQCS